MQNDPQAPLAVATNLIALERGAHELLLVDGACLRPVYFDAGREYIKRYLAAVRELSTKSRLQEIFPNDGPLLDMLMAHGIIGEQGSHPVPADSAILRQATGKKSGLTLYLLLSQSCNMGCFYCLNGTESYQRHANLKMTEEVAYKSIDQALGMLEPEAILRVALFGGEPLLNWSLGKKVILYCESVKPHYEGITIEYYLTSNLSILPSDLIDWAKKYRVGILSDIDGPDHIHNHCRPYKNGRPSYDQVVRNVRAILNSGYDIQLRATVTAVNQDLIMDIARHHKELGAGAIAFVPVIPVNSDENFLSDDFLPSPELLFQGVGQVFHSNLWDYRSIFPFSSFVSHLNPGGRVAVGCGTPHGATPVVDARGDVYPCIYLVGIRRFYQGNILDGSYPDHTVCDRLLNLLHVDHNEECKGCAWRYLCGGGCPVLRLAVLENPKATATLTDYCKGVYCNYSKKILELLLWRKAEEAAADLQRRYHEKPQTTVRPAPTC